MVARIGVLGVAVLVLVGAAQIGGRVAGGYTLAYEGYCTDQIVIGTCLQDTRTGIVYTYSHIVGASWLADMSQAVISDQGRVLILNRHGTTLHSISSNTDYFATPQWSADGSLIVFEGADQSFTRGGYELWVSNPTGTDKQAIDRLRHPSQRPRAYWSPDGTRFVYFGTLVTTTGVTEVRLCSLTTQSCQEPGTASQPHANWSADGGNYILSPGRNVVHIIDGETGIVLEEIRAFNEEYSQQYGAASAARMVLTPTYYAQDMLLFSYIPHSRSYAVGPDRVLRPVDGGLGAAALIHSLPVPNRLLLIDPRTAVRTLVHELDLAADDYVVRPIGQIYSSQFIGVVQW